MIKCGCVTYQVRPSILYQNEIKMGKQKGAGRTQDKSLNNRSQLGLCIIFICEVDAGG